MPEGGEGGLRSGKTERTGQFNVASAESEALGRGGSLGEVGSIVRSRKTNNGSAKGAALSNDQHGTRCVFQDLFGVASEQ
jgi:hypothetical protein